MSDERESVQLGKQMKEAFKMIFPDRKGRVDVKKKKRRKTERTMTPK